MVATAQGPGQRPAGERAGSDKSLGGGVPENIDGGVPKKIDGGVPETIDGGVPKKLDWDAPEKTAGKTPALSPGASGADKRPAPVIVNPAKHEADARWELGFCVDEIIKDKGFISRNQCRGNEYKQSLFFMVMTNTANLVRGDWLGGLAGEFRKAGVMTNEFEQLQVIVPTGQPRSIQPPKYDR